MMSSAADLIAQGLHGAGVRHAFGIPGGEVLTVLEALDRVGIEFILTKHENAAGFMAEGAWHAAQAPGVLVATLGPGLANAVNVIANALQDRVPLIFLTGCVDARDAVTYTHQVFDQTALLESITKASFTAADGAVDVIIDKALAIALDDPPGPVHIDVPISLAAQEQPGNAQPRRAPVSRGVAGGMQLDRARQWLRAAHNPILIAGLEALGHHAESAVAEFVTELDIPLITTYKAKGILPEDHPLCLGGAGLSPKADTILLPLLSQSDLIILAGYDPIEMRSGWRNPWPAETRVIEFSGTPNHHYMHQASLNFCADVGASLKVLAAEQERKAHWPGGEAGAAREALKAMFQAGEQWGPATIIAVARECAPRTTVASVDSGAHRILLSQMWECYQPRTLLQSTGLCTMGCAVPLAAGYKLVASDQPVIAFVGDAGLEMMLGDLATLRSMDTPIVVIVFVDRSLSLIELKQRHNGMPNLGVDFAGTDFVKVAEGLGLHGLWIDDAKRLRTELKDALVRRQQPTLLACRIDRKAYDGTF